MSRHVYVGLAYIGMVIAYGQAGVFDINAPESYDEYEIEWLRRIYNKPVCVIKDWCWLEFWLEKEKVNAIFAKNVVYDSGDNCPILGWVCTSKQIDTESKKYHFVTDHKVYYLLGIGKWTTI